MHAISTINIEVTSRCNKDCWMCGRRKLEKETPGWAEKMGDMDYRIVIELARQIPAGTVVQLHWNGEPMLYPLLADAAGAFRKAGCIVAMDTNGSIVDQPKFKNFHSITVSVIQGDTPENYSRQISTITHLAAMFPKKRKVIRALGNIPPYTKTLAKQLGFLYVPRILHSPDMSRDYEKPVTMPEIGICLDLLHHPAIDRHGNVFPCVRINPKGENLLGNVMETPLDQILGGDHRKNLIENHIAGNRYKVPLCCECDYWGIPRG
jgi:radical SAM protein with 4Fe4S-binding SPASM domain